MAPTEPFEHDSNPTTDRRLASLEDEVRALRQGQSDQTAITAAMVEKVNDLARDLSDNSAKTGEVYEIAQTFKGAGRVVQGAGAVIKWGATVGAALTAAYAAYKGIKE